MQLLLSYISEQAPCQPGYGTCYRYNIESGEYLKDFHLLDVISDACPQFSLGYHRTIHRFGTCSDLLEIRHYNWMIPQIIYEGTGIAEQISLSLENLLTILLAIPLPIPPNL